MDSNSISWAPSNDRGELPKRDTHWKILSVDDDPEVHHVTKLVLSEFEFEGIRPLIVTADSAQQASDYLRKHSDVVLVLLDVVMERDHSGFDVVKTIRQELNNHQVRIVIRTGQAGSFDLESTMAKYDVDGFLDKGDLTHNYLFTTVYSAFRSYRDSQLIIKNQSDQARFIKTIQGLNYIRDTEQLITQMIVDLQYIVLDVVSACIVIANDKNIDVYNRELISHEERDPENIVSAQRDYLQHKSNHKNATVQIKNQILFRHDLSNGEIFKLHLITRHELNGEIKALFIAYCANVSSLYELGQVSY